jgi:primosomal protein N' (replication factor Y)
LRFAREQDYDGFYTEELKFRQRLGYPPFVVLASVIIKHRELATASKYSNLLRRALDAANTDRMVRVLGPAPASLSRLKNEYRIQIVIKAPNRRGLRERLNIALVDAEANGCDLRAVHVEIDPVNLM